MQKKKNHTLLRNKTKQSVPYFTSTVFLFLSRLEKKKKIVNPEGCTAQIQIKPKTPAAFSAQSVKCVS